MTVNYKPKGIPIEGGVADTVADVLGGPASIFRAITPSNTVNFPNGPTRGIYVGTAGDATIVDLEGNATTFVGLLAGVVYPFIALRVNATGTDADDLVGLY